ncbi:MAG: PRC-barrel domain-containing protein [Solirubrobacterales bacterium]
MSEREHAAPPSAQETAGWIGASLTEVGGDRVGSVDGFYVDSESGEPVWLIARLGRRRGTRVVAVPIAECAGFPAGVWTAQGADALRRAPVVDPVRPLRREHELTICGHFGVGARVGRAAALAGRAEGEVTATPPVA